MILSEATYHIDPALAPRPDMAPSHCKELPAAPVARVFRAFDVGVKTNTNFHLYPNPSGPQ